MTFSGTMTLPRPASPFKKVQLIDDKMRSVSPSSSEEDSSAPETEEELKKRWVGDIHLTEGTFIYLNHAPQHCSHHTH